MGPDSVLLFPAAKRDRQRFDDLIVEARAALRDVAAGDLVALYSADLATTRAVRLLITHRWDAA